MSISPDTIITIPDPVLGDIEREPIGGNTPLGGGPSYTKRAVDEDELDIDRVELGSSFIGSGSAQTAELRKEAFDSAFEDDGEASNEGLETHDGVECPALVDSEIQPFSEPELHMTCGPYGFKRVPPPSLPLHIFGFQIKGTPKTVVDPTPHHSHLPDGGVSITMGSGANDFPYTTSRPNSHMAVKKHYLVSSSTPTPGQQLFTEVEESNVTSLRELVGPDLSFLSFEPHDAPTTRHDGNPKCAYINLMFTPASS